MSRDAIQFGTAGRSWVTHDCADGPCKGQAIRCSAEGAEDVVLGIGSAMSAARWGL